MKQLLGTLLFFVLAVVIGVPTFLVRGCDLSVQRGREGDGGDLPGIVRISLFVEGDGEVIELPLEEYVAGVVAAEMPASFHLEALKAQAVAARTYAVKRMRAFGGPGSDRHPGSDICSDPTHSQAWSSVPELKKKWGFLGFYRNWSKVVRAVRETEGLVIAYGGLPADALYHSTSGGVTEDAAEVWGRPVPYLQSVESPYERHSPRYEAAVTFTVAELARRLGLDEAALKSAFRGPHRGEANDVTATGRAQAGLAGEPVQLVAASATGRVKKVSVGGKVFTGNDLRTLLNLNSTLLTWETSPDGERVTFRTRGYGHGVGMSQYGADGMAREGKSYLEILAHYYRGVEVRRLFAE